MNRQQLIEALYRNELPLTQEYHELIQNVIEDLDQGLVRVADKNEKGDWIVNTWVKEAILLYFKICPNQPMDQGVFQFQDKIWPKKKLPANIRIVPPGVARYGSYLSAGVILMPGYVNIGAYVGEGSMVDTWATVGSCAQIGKGVHLSGGVGIGGVLEPPSAVPVIIEDHAFIGSRAIVVEGVRVGEGAVLGANVVLTASTAIIDVTQSEEIVYKGFVPPRSVVIPGMRTKKFPAGEYQIPCALIIGQRQASTDMKVSLNQALRDFSVSV
jgi:2,3,4,5-tetrahydropyridine-2-carboxylate N-succinyltransferase